MSEPKITQKAPYVVEEAPGKKFWCSCGHSAKQPYCDGSHARAGTTLRPIMVEITEKKKVAWCGCRHSKAGATCDGSHKQLP
jgi:CDGSH-type Zn-finger protein